MPTQFELASQMIQQLRLLDPSVSAEVGSPERKMIDTFAQALNDSQIDLSALQTSLDIDSKYGSQLDRFLSIFGFRRQVATFSTGFVTFSRTTPATTDIRIPANTLVRAPAQPNGDSVVTDVTFYTTFDVVLVAGQTSVSAPITAQVAGTLGNQGTNRIVEMVGTTVLGITSVTNEAPTGGGIDLETDDEYKVRFKNTVFRNLAGTQDQYLALAISTAFSTRANVVGPQSHYREYVQIPSVADNASYDINSDATPDAGGGNANEYTTALSTIPYAKYLWSSLPVFVNNGQTGVTSLFYRQDVDFRYNTVPAARARGDALRLYTAYLATTSPQPNPSDATLINPNVTFLNVYTGATASVQAVRPGDVVLFEFSYMSDASRNDLTNNITNAVDVFIDGTNPTLATAITVRPTTAFPFVDNQTSKYHYENYRRIDDPIKRPLIGNVLQPLYWQPVIDVPDQIVIGTVTYFKNVHYWPVRDASDLRGTIRARSGIEWSTKVFGKASGDPLSPDPSTYTGKVATDVSGDPAGGQPVTITNYTYDRNISDLQSALEGAKQITTDVLAHRVSQRYFRFDVTVMYVPGVSVADTNNQIQSAVDRFLRSQFFGSSIQLSDILQTIHNVSGVDNVRWTSDIPLPTGSPAPVALPRGMEANSLGQPLLGVTTERTQPGTASRVEIQSIFINGQPNAGNFYLTTATETSTSLGYNVSAATLQSTINAFTGIGSVTVAEDARSTTGVKYPIRSFTVTWGSNGARAKLGAQVLSAALPLLPPLSGGPFVINNDFFLRDNELAALPLTTYTPPIGTPDTVAGIIIRPRAQGTWTRGI